MQAGEGWYRFFLLVYSKSKFGEKASNEGGADGISRRKGVNKGRVGGIVG
jgi:hypothetical protein